MGHNIARKYPIIGNELMNFRVDFYFKFHLNKIKIIMKHKVLKLFYCKLVIITLIIFLIYKK